MSEGVLFVPSAYVVCAGNASNLGVVGTGIDLG